ncbi:MAG: hypothetical protein IT204_19670 [Fimbriimonadaceae bacterium]|nr:hypothetical protein [Fimbriimonadaceae bacterium]
MSSNRPPVWLGPALVLIAVTSILCAARLFPVADERPLKMSCYWAGQAVIAFGALLGVCGLLASAVRGTEAGRVVCWLAWATGAVQIFTTRLLIPYMPHSALHQRVHDLLASAAVMVAGAALVMMRPEPNLNEALDAAAAARKQPRA